MLLTLAASSLRSMLLPSRGKKPKMDLLELPTFARQTLGLHGLNLSTDLLAGADRARLDSLRERADKSGSAILLLSEPNGQKLGGSDADALKGQERMIRVIEAGQILGASAVSMFLDAPDTEKAFAAVIERLKPIVERAERLDLNLLIGPTDGLTKTPERITDLVKRVGGFRIGTFPDFQTAAASADPAAYLRRLTPYATAVCASTVSFPEEPEAPAPAPAPAADAAPKGPNKPAADEDEMFDKLEEALMMAGVEDDDEEGDLGELGLDDDDELPPLKSPRHEPYDLKIMVRALADVGYDGPLSIDYRGTGDVTLGLEQSRDALLAALAQAAESA
jgi:sugar phosphate isomerase/epimerase